MVFSVSQVRRRLRKMRTSPTAFRLALQFLAITYLLRYVFRLLFSSGRGSDEASIAFFIQASNATLLHLPRLLNALYHPNNHYVVHLDAKIPARERAIAAHGLMEGRRQNVRILPAEHVTYAGVSMVANTLNGLEMLLAAEWDFFINLSGADYPLIKPGQLRKMLGADEVRRARPNFLQEQRADHDEAWFRRRRLSRLHVDRALWRAPAARDSGERRGGEAYDVDKRGLNDGGDSRGPLGTENEHADQVEGADAQDGSIWAGAENQEALFVTNTSHPGVSDSWPAITKTEGWVILHREFAEYAARSAASRRQLLALANARAADELFFGALLRGAGERFRETRVADALRLIVWAVDGQRLARPAVLDRLDAREEKEELEQEKHEENAGRKEEEDGDGGDVDGETMSTDRVRRVRRAVVEAGALFARKIEAPDAELLDFVDDVVDGETDARPEMRDTAAAMRAAARRRLRCALWLGVTAGSCVFDEVGTAPTTRRSTVA